MMQTTSTLRGRTFRLSRASNRLYHGGQYVFIRADDRPFIESYIHDEDLARLERIYEARMDDDSARVVVGVRRDYGSPPTVRYAD